MPHSLLLLNFELGCFSAQTISRHPVLNADMPSGTSSLYCARVAEAEEERVGKVFPMALKVINLVR